MEDVAAFFETQFIFYVQFYKQVDQRNLKNPS